VHALQEVARIRILRWPEVSVPALLTSARERFRATFATTPDRFRLARTVLVVGLLLAGTAAAGAAEAASQSTRDIAGRIEPISAGATTLYRSLAEADAIVTSGFLTGGLESSQTRKDYDDSISEATTSLATTGAQAGDEAATAARVEDIATLLPVYTGLVEQARANNRQGLPVGAAYLQRASDLMRSTMLPAAEAVQVRQAVQLDSTYATASAVPLSAILLGGALLAALGGVQWYLFRTTNRVFNLGVLVATGAVLLGGLWWAVAGTVANGHLERSRAHIQSVTDALVPAQIAALQARAAESLSLITRDGGAREVDFAARIQLLARNNGEGGALGAARALAPDTSAADAVEHALTQVRDYVAAHEEVRRLDNDGSYTTAVHSAASSEPSSSASTFTGLDDTLAAAVESGRQSFDEQIEQARVWRTGLTVGIALLAVVAVVGASWGINQRLEEYR